ncbi:MAG: hypothetical protein ACJAT7_003036 [Psychromonas sp.]|jgi:hypothetical protein|uniref:sulfatase-like hydrolase/transferase n=1 Tax=Psychromonas sp. TaxID=1884585 RepID=UPI0039E39F83
MKNNSSVEPVSVKRTFFRTVALLLLLSVLILNYRSSLQPYSDISILTIFSAENTKTVLNGALIVDLSFFALTFFFLQLFWAYIICTSCKPFFNITENNNIRTLTWLIIVVLHLLLSICANSYYTPTSLLAIFRESFLSSIFFIASLGFCLFALFIGSLLTEKKYIRALLIVAICVFFSLPYSFNLKTASAATINQPNIIIIGLDALRPDHLNIPYKSSTLTPAIDGFIKNSISYQDTYTTVARTFVAWFSLLKSQYPITHGGRFNLTPDNFLDKKLEFTDLLKEKGYHTLYAMDERRFNPIDESYGFDLAIGPETGFADQLITSIADFPIINILANTKLAEYFMPYIFTNRGNGKTYDPTVFNNRVLNNLSVNNANFLAVHFCMLHWPFTSKDFINVDTDLWQDNYSHFMYLSLLNKLDMQFKDFMDKLEQQGMLENALVFIFSDHGESFKLTADKLTPREAGLQLLNVDAWGHGTNILDQKQAKILLSYSEYKNGKRINQAKVINGNFSIIDIVPTIAQKLNLNLTKSEGAPLPLENNSLLNNRFIFVESSLPVKAINNSFIDTKKVFYETKDNYRVNKKGKVILKPEKYFDFIPKKQRSVYFQDWQLVMLPEMEDLILIDLIAKNWIPSALYKGKAPLKAMLHALCKHYENDYKFDPYKACSNRY